MKPIFALIAILMASTSASAASAGGLEELLVIKNGVVVKDIYPVPVAKNGGLVQDWMSVDEMAADGSDDLDEEAPAPVEKTFCDAFGGDTKDLCVKADEQERLGKSAVSPVLNYLRAAFGAAGDARRELLVKAAKVAQDRVNDETFELALKAACRGHEDCSMPAAKPVETAKYDYSRKPQTQADRESAFDENMRIAQAKAEAEHAKNLALRASQCPAAFSNCLAKHIAAQRAADHLAMASF